MKRSVHFFLLTLMIASCSVLHRTPGNQSPKIKFSELDYGICKTTTVYQEHMENSPSGNYSQSTGFKLLEQTDKIPGKIGQEFGIEYILRSGITTDILIEQVWIFPGTITDDQGKKFKELRYSVSKPTNERTYSVYTLEKDFEVVKGTWTYQMFYKGKKIYERKFYVE